jgi:hypothetical protein
VTPEPENLSRASIRTLVSVSGPCLKRSIGISEPEPEEPETRCSFQQLQPQSTGFKEKGTQARCEDPISTKNMPISGKLAIVLYVHTIDSVAV